MRHPEFTVCLPDRKCLVLRSTSMGISVKSLLFCLAASCFVICGGGLPTRRLQQVRAGAEDLAAFRRAGCDNFTNDQWQPLRPGYHITVPYGWLNDPHGLFQRNGTTHMFFQYNPRALAWGAPFWGHVVSQDLVHWTWLPPALLPDQPYDRGGVWSGSATIDNEGVPVLTYTAAGSSVPEYGNFFQQQAAAVPEDLSDPLLKRWRKLASNPFLTQVRGRRQLAGEKWLWWHAVSCASTTPAWRLKHLTAIVRGGVADTSAVHGLRLRQVLVSVTASGTTPMRTTCPVNS
eukprot:GHRQ01031021.1.p1 GENE.GHRQ01031021.1~~GHRQ01031021.1.p1  ORF type:complete len:289 (+),score=47.53 GHRQ01031021.1:214-1080(+)